MPIGTRNKNYIRMITLLGITLLPTLYFIIRQMIAKNDEQMTKYTLIGLVYLGFLIPIWIIIFLMQV